MQLKALVFVLAFIAHSTVVKSEIGNLDWWKHASFYQVYPRSFKDSNNNGIGDLQGIISKLDHFKDSAVDAVWLSPIFKSPQMDLGYDISDYRDVDPDYGTLDDLMQLIDQAHLEKIKIILDFVPNHTSDKHQWFIDSVNGVEEYRDYYIWTEAKVDENGDNQPPNNWISLFKGSAWTWNEKRKQYYLHQFSSAGPDLNYRNPKVVQAMKDILTFWLDHGVDGFRIDAVPFLFENKDLQDEPLSPSTGYSNTDYEYLDHIYTMDLPETIDMIYQWRKLVDDYTNEHGGDTRVLMTEAYTDLEKTLRYYGTEDGSKLGAHFSFNFQLITDVNINSTANDIVYTINEWLNAVLRMYISNWVLGNHDNHRVATRFGVENVDGYNMLKSFLPGVSVTYNGEEIGQEDGEVTYEEGKDPTATDPATFEEISRDFERTPYQWDDTVNAGFNTGAEPWLPVSKKYVDTNLLKEKEDEVSHFKVYQASTQLRANLVLVYGKAAVEAIGDYTVLVKRSYNGSFMVLVFNVGNDDAEIDVSEYVSQQNSIVIKNIDSSKKLGSSVDPSNLMLDAHEALILSF